MTGDETRFAELEIKIAFLEKHVSEQDRAMMEMTRRADLLERALNRMSERVKRLDDGPPSGASSPGDERPPHY